MSDERAIIRVYRVWKTVHQLVHDRGYEMAQEELDITLEQFKSQYCSAGGIDKVALQFYANAPPGSTNGQIYVAFCKNPAVGIKDMRDFVQTLNDQNHKVGILIYEKNMTPSANKIVQGVQNQFQIDTFQESDLVVNITHHELVPRHIIMTPTEKKELLAKYKLKETQLPRIQMADPVARYYGLRRGQVVKIIRRSETSGRYSSYRICAG
ncbi:DNA-directed RNA polymerase I [Taphrina deformans PYCC 5710]|uniref:DNA-directed RNA polymerases I, II, and III subunit RPABC1 n=1 Tax=Taphrina deformans (strain PYCC 5710 / ATCC 11124 / CBS 356.35 / IMI 108563 / JCM 9778 / NBRC 8474) TaxID=1097556 RepID=R4XGA4_TAPDE|nr:DNA-directed RNA polymerase I [Taphrina deformans PYCC 5710]|eukprot:CCG83524.1 DNA-directed RNA polymerase I [Taphrina deformans PYCC 5710]